MRPTLVRPDLGEIHDRFELGIEGASSCPGDRPCPRRMRVLKRLVLTTYEQLMDMSDDNVTHSDWAWSMRMVVETCLREIMQLGLMRTIYDLVFSLHCGCMGAPVTRGRLDKYSTKYGSYQTTFKDAYEITCDYFRLYRLDEKKLKAFCAQHDQDTALEIVLAAIVGEKPPMVDEEARETVREIRNSIWKSARETYFKLKNDGRETYDLDVVFDNEEPPFPNHVFMSLASHFFADHGWLPVGDNVGIFKDQNMTLKARRTASPDLLDRLGVMFNHHGIVLPAWLSSWTGLPESARRALPETMWMSDSGRFSMAVYKPAFEREKLLIDMFPAARNLPASVLLRVSLFMHQTNTLNSNVLLHMEDYFRTRTEGRYQDMPEKDPRGGNIRVDLDTCFREMVACNFGFDKVIKNGQMPGFESFQKTGKITGLPFQSLIDQFHDASMFCFLRELLTTYNPEHVNKGPFLQACVDYANKHDPEIWHDGDDDWTLWLVTNMIHPLIVCEKPLFASFGQLDKTEICVEGKTFKVTAKGSVCYAYNRCGKGMYAVGYLCEAGAVNLMSHDTFLRLRGASVRRDHDHSLLEMPLLKTEISMGGEEKVFWKGQEIGRVDLRYWHERLGHISGATMKNYQKVIKGLPPYFWW
ncbi:YALIA101S01e16820g1_1 [Yarrowia lipolytica]|nr:Hypothetical protein YALI2_C00250g [Yarrowia lipolytica]SEI31181.1 YALIA101S01e16820g1_1 [Yarrowia lipolytica]